MNKIETNRLILRGFNVDDFEAVHSYASNAGNTMYMQFGPNSEDDTREFINQAIISTAKTPITHYLFAAELKETGKLIGECELQLETETPAIGWIVHRDYWRKGYGTEMGMALLKLGFEEHNLHRIIARCDEDNLGSTQLMTKIGMRREGLFLDNRKARAGSPRPYKDELIYAILQEEWYAQKEIAYYNALPCEFDNFINVPVLSDGELYLVCIEKTRAFPELSRVPAYRFAVCISGEKIGEVTLRVGYTNDLYYSGQIGYAIYSTHRGNNYATRATKLMLPIAKAHGMQKLLITNNYINSPSRRVCEKLGARHLRQARLPEWATLYKEGQRFVNIYEWSVT